MRSLARFLALSIVVLFSFTAEARIYIPVDQPSDKKFPIAIPDLRGGSGKDIASVIRNDMKLSGFFEMLSPDLYNDVAKKEGDAVSTIQFSYWAAIGAQALVKGSVESEGGKSVVTLRLFDPVTREMIVGKQYKAEKKELRTVAHKFSDEIMEALTGIRGVFNTKITYAAETGKGRKEIFVMDMDGYGAHAITKNKTISISPCWSPDGSQIAFTSYLKGNPDLYIMNSGGGGMKRLSMGKGANLTPSWSPDGGRIAFSSSIGGISNLYTIPPGGGKMQRVTSTGSIDIAPTWSPDGGSLIYSSEKAGGLHVFRTGANGGGEARLTFVGYQNDMPDWSPMGDKVVFAGRDMGTFDIFIMNADGSNIQRLTVASGSNEHPTFSPDGRYITFSSTREGGSAVFIMRSDGTNQTRVSEGNGILPEWGPQIN